MHTPIAALTWDIWRRNRAASLALTGIIVLARLLTDIGVRVPNSMLAIISVICVFGIFGYTEFNTERGWVGFPHRLFVLPVTTLTLVTLPVVLGIAATEAVYFAWAGLAVDAKDAAWPALLLGVYMVFFQTVLWILPGLRALRLIAAGVIGIVVIEIGFLPTFPHSQFNEATLSVQLVAAAIVAFCIAWAGVAQQRRGGRREITLHKTLSERVVTALPGRSAPFASAMSAQCWFEWRTAGMLLPLLVAGMLLLVVGPLSWRARDVPVDFFRILEATLAMPLVFSLVVGKGFSKPDLWSNDLAIPSFLAVRPLTSADLVAVKTKVAAFSSLITWLIVAVFLSLWLPLWANPKALTQVEALFSRAYGPSPYIQSAILSLALLTGAIVTWTFLIDGLWIGLSGSKTLFTASALPYAFVPVALIIFPVILRQTYRSIQYWIFANLDALFWIATLAIAVKLTLAALSWRKSMPDRIGVYLSTWLVGTACVSGFIVLLWTGVPGGLPAPVYQIRNLLLMIAALIVPLARIGLAPTLLKKNRHR